MRCNTYLSKEEMNRYSRQIRLAEVGKEGQEKIKGTSVVVIGAGALGCPVLQYLSAAGVGILGIVDNDWVDETNLQRQVLYTTTDNGKPKPVAAKEKLKLLNPEVTYKAHFMHLDKQSALRTIYEYDIIVDCTDNFATRYLINDACVILKKPLVYGAVNRFSGHLIVLNYNGGPTLRCLYPEPPEPFEVQSCAETGVIGSVAGIIGSMQATEVIKIILGQEEILSGKLFCFDSLSFTTQIVSFGRNNENLKVDSLDDYDDDYCTDIESVKELSAFDLKRMVGENPDLTIVDLREETEKEDIGFKCVSIPYYEISQKINNFLKQDSIVFYCKHGIQSMNVINYLRRVHKMENL
jgi:sulfur-carrier protein adenylyltransferase/sulfurtransferase